MVISTRSGRTSRRITTGTTTLPIVINTPMTMVPTITAPTSPDERRIAPSATPTTVTVTAASGPTPRITTSASGVARAKHSTGMLVRIPAWPEESMRSLRRVSITGATATIGPRRTTATSATATMKSHGALRRESVNPLSGGCRGLIVRPPAARGWRNWRCSGVGTGRAGMWRPRRRACSECRTECRSAFGC